MRFETRSKENVNAARFIDTPEFGVEIGETPRPSGSSIPLGVKEALTRSRPWFGYPEHHSRRLYDKDSHAA